VAAALAGEALGRALFAAVGARHGFVLSADDNGSNGDGDGRGAALVRLADLERFLLDANTDLAAAGKPAAAGAVSGNVAARPSSPAAPVAHAASTPATPDSSFEAAHSAPPPAPPLQRPKSPPAAASAPLPAREPFGEAPSAAQAARDAKPAQGAARAAEAAATDAVSRLRASTSPASAAHAARDAACATEEAEAAAARASPAHGPAPPSASPSRETLAPDPLGEAWQRGFFAATQAQQTAASSAHTAPAASAAQVLAAAKPPPGVPAELRPYLSSPRAPGAVPLAELSLGEVEDLLWGVGFGESAAAMVEGHSIDGARKRISQFNSSSSYFFLNERGLCQSEYTHF
jgi:hypothetical protein